MRTPIVLAILIFSFLAGARDFEKAPKGEGPFPTLIVLHDIWGLDNFVKREVERYADNGYYVYAVDMYNGYLPPDLASASRFRDKLSTDDLLAKVKRSYDRIHKLKKVDKLRIGILGWGLGGGIALRSAIRIPEIRALVMNYGEPVAEKGEVKKMKAKSLFIFGEDDVHISKDNIRNFRWAMDETHLLYEIKVMPHAKYGFFDYTRTDSFDPKPSEDGKKQILAFLNKHLALTEFVK